MVRSIEPVEEARILLAATEAGTVECTAGNPSRDRAGAIGTAAWFADDVRDDFSAVQP